VVLGNFVMHVALGLVLLATGSFALLASTLGVSR
jgi:hypothetical protein